MTLTPLRLLGLLLILTAASWGAEPASTPSTTNPRFKQTHAHIEALFQNRRTSAKAPDPRQNPFRTAGELLPSVVQAPVSPGENAPPAPAPSSDEDLLRQAVATLKVGGIVLIDGRAQLTINKDTYKEGDILTARVQAVPVYLRIRQITSNSIVFVLNNAELTLRF